MKNPCMVLELPEEEEIAVSEEVRSDSYPGAIIKTIRYRNGLVLILTQDFSNRVYRVELFSGQSSLFQSGNNIVSID